MQGAFGSVCAFLEWIISPYNENRGYWQAAESIPPDQNFGNKVSLDSMMNKAFCLAMLSVC